jgi:F1F0 ATPase subunit 2
MTTSQFFLDILYPAGVGVLLGMFFFGSAWLVVRKLTVMKHPAIFFVSSMIIRISVVVTVLYALFSDSWLKLLLALAGLLIARSILIYIVKSGIDHDKKVRRRNEFQS